MNFVTYGTGFLMDKRFRGQTLSRSEISKRYRKKQKLKIDLIKRNIENIEQKNQYLIFLNNFCQNIIIELRQLINSNSSFIYNAPAELKKFNGRYLICFLFNS